MRLSHAVREFNKNIAKLEIEKNKLVLPEKIEYKDVKSKIWTRYELNRQIRALKRFSRENEQKILNLQNDVEITNWEYKELKKEKKRAEKRLASELIQVKEENAGKRAGFRTAKEKEIEANIKSLDKLFSAKGFDFKQIRKRIHKIGGRDYELYKADIFRKNFYRALEDTKSYKNYKLLKAKLDSIKNPIEFFEYIGQSEALSDLFLFYKNGDGLVYGSFATNEDAFDYGLDQLGLI